jgi:hypothetical protein
MSNSIIKLKRNELKELIQGMNQVILYISMDKTPCTELLFYQLQAFRKLYVRLQAKLLSQKDNVSIIIQDDEFLVFSQWKCMMAPPTNQRLLDYIYGFIPYDIKKIIENAKKPNQH